MIRHHSIEIMDLRLFSVFNMPLFWSARKKKNFFLITPNLKTWQIMMRSMGATWKVDMNWGTVLWEKPKWHTSDFRGLRSPGLPKATSRRVYWIYSQMSPQIERLLITKCSSLECYLMTSQSADQSLRIMNIHGLPTEADAASRGVKRLAFDNIRRTKGGDSKHSFMFRCECTGILSFLSKRRMSDLHSCSKHEKMDIELNEKLRELSLLKSPCKTRKSATYLGDDEDHSQREHVRSAMSPSPRQDERRRAEQKSGVLAELSNSYKTILKDIGENPERQGLLRTPDRAAKALLYFTKGYDEKIAGTKICNACGTLILILLYKKYLYFIFGLLYKYSMMFYFFLLPCYKNPSVFVSHITYNSTFSHKWNCWPYT